MKMKLLVLLVMLSFVLGSCAQPTPEVQTIVETVVVEVPGEEQVVVETVVVTVEPEVVAPSEADTIKIGFYGPLTGPVSKAGRALMQGAKMKFEEVNAAGGLLGKQIEFVTCDDKSVPEEAVKCVQRLYNEENVVVNIGSLHSPHLMATGPLLDEFKIPTVAVGTSPTWCQQGFEYLWRGTANAAAATAALAKVFEGAGFEKIALLYQNDDYGISGKDALKESLSFMEAVKEEAYNLGDKDWSGQIISMLSANPDVVGVWALGEDTGPIINQLRGQGWDGIIIGPEGATYPEIPVITGENSNGVVFAQLYYIPEKPEDYPLQDIAEFLQKYLDTYAEMPADDNAYRGWDSATILVTAMENAGSTEPEAVKDAINSISDLDGLAGVFNFADGGCEGILTSQVWQWKDGKIVPFEGFE